MKIEEQNILMFSRTMGLGGTEKVVLQLCEILKPHAHKIVVCSTGGVMVQKLAEMGIKHYKIPDVTEKSPWIVMRIMRQLNKIIRQECITVVHTHHRMAAFYAMFLQKKNCFTYIATAHNTFNDKRVLTRLAYRNCHVIACGSMVKRNLIEFFGLPAQQVTVIHNAVPAFIDTIVPDKTVQKLHQAGYFLIGNIGRLSAQKGMKYFLQACAMVKKQVPEVRFLIVGTGEERAGLEQLRDKLGLQKDVFFLGYRQDIQNLMSQLDLVVLSSLWEGLPLTPLEAFSVGKTIVATNVDGTAEEVIDGSNGILVPKADAKALADGMLELYHQPEKRERMAVQAAETYRRKFSIDSYRERILAYYHSIQ